MRAHLFFTAALALDAQSLVTSYLGLTAEQLAAIERNGKEYDQAAKTASIRGEALRDEIKRETMASPLNVTRLDILHTESVMSGRDWERREAAIVAANQALLTPAQVEKVLRLEREEDLGYLYLSALSAALQVDPCAESRGGTEISPKLIEHLGLDGVLLQQLTTRNRAFEESVRSLSNQRAENSNLITDATRAREIDSEELGRLYAAQIAISREIANRRKQHTLENRALLGEGVLDKLQHIETVAGLESTLYEARIVHLLKQRNGFFFSYSSSCH